MKDTSQPIKQALWQIPLLICLSILTSLASNYWRSDALPLSGNWSMETRFSVPAEENLVIPLDKAEQLFHRKTVKFIDARSKTEYANGHILGALSLSWQDVDRDYTEIAGLLDASENIVTYCDGEACDLSHDLALFLKEMGYQNVQVLVNGWTEWNNAGLPTEREN